MRWLLVLAMMLVGSLAMAAGRTSSAARTAEIPFVPVAMADELFIYDEHGQRDPFWPLVTAGGAIVTYDTNFAVAEMTLEGVVSDGEGGIAIINGTVVEQGKQLGEYLVEKIEQDKVTLIKDGQVSVLRIKKEE